MYNLPIADVIENFVEKYNSMKKDLSIIKGDYNKIMAKYNSYSELKALLELYLEKPQTGGQITSFQTFNYEYLMETLSANAINIFIVEYESMKSEIEHIYEDVKKIKQKFYNIKQEVNELES